MVCDSKQLIALLDKRMKLGMLERSSKNKKGIYNQSLRVVMDTEEKILGTEN